MDFRCYYCPLKFGDLETIINHCTTKHDTELLRYRQLVLCPESGHMKYQSKLHEGLVPRQLHDEGKVIQVRNEEVFIYDSKLKKKKLNTPVKGKEVRRALSFAASHNSIQTESHKNETFAQPTGGGISDLPDKTNVTENVEQMSNLLPVVLQTLHEEGQLETYMKFNYMLASREFPTKNICYLLFLDLVDWFHCDNTSRMRYRPETVKFWQIGYRLFHGKYLRFMSGLRNFGQILQGLSNRGVHDPVDSKINFAVPSRQNLYSKQEDSKLFYPGINDLSIATLAEKLGNKPMKLSVDGKKISRGKGKTMGDVDCWGYENKPTLEERRTVHKAEITVVESIESRVDSLEEKGLVDLANISDVEKTKVKADLKIVVQNLALNNKLLRDKIKSLDQMEVKFKKLGGEDWKTSRFYPVICSVRVANIETKKQLDDSLVITNKLAFYGATLNNSQEMFCNSDTIVMSDQPNFHQLNSDFVTNDTRLIPQRSDKWFKLREAAMVTGSTCHKALGLGTLKQQNEHFDIVVNKADKPSPTEDIQRRMEYGTKHEIDAVATVTAKVLPFLYPDYKYIEEGCIQVPYKDQASFLVVSPDGSFRKCIDGSAMMMYENKCKAPNSFSSSAYYKIPDYYVVQLLCEMHAYNCPQLLFTCWSEQSMTVFCVEFDDALWETCWNELVRLYGNEKNARQTRFSAVAKELKNSIKVFAETKVTLLAEFPACRAVMPSSVTDKQGHSEPYSRKVSNPRAPELVCLSQFQEALVLAKKWFDQTYQLLRTVASEILVYMVNDLDRMFDMELSNAHPIAYALKGPSLKVDAFRNMTDKVIEQCEENGLSIVVTASDGQWHQYGVRDTSGKPLTLHQLHRDHWTSVKAKDKSTILAEIKNTYKVDSLDNVKMERKGKSLIVYSHNKDTFLSFTKSRESESRQDSGDTQEQSISDCSTDTTAPHEICLDGDFVEKVDAETQDEVDAVSCQPLQYSFLSEIHNTVTASYDIQEDISWLFDNSDGRHLTENVVSDSEEHELNQTISILRGAHDVVYGQFVPGDNSSMLQDLDLSTTHTLNSFVCDDVTVEGLDYTCANDKEQEGCFLDDNHGLDTLDLSHFDDLHSTEQSSERLVSENAFICVEDTYCLNEMIDEHTTNQNDTKSTPSNPSSSLENEKLFDFQSYEKMLLGLQNDARAMQVHNWSTVDTATFCTYFSSKQNLEKHFQKYELSLCLKTMSDLFVAAGIVFKPNWPKYRLTEFTLEHINDRRPVREFETPVPIKKSVGRRRKVPTLKTLTGAVVSKFPKEILMIILAEKTWDHAFNEWQNVGPIPGGIDIDGVTNGIQWFSQPCVDSDGKVRFHFTDACHILTCLRTKICTTGVSGLRRKAWEAAALSDETTLNISVVVDCVDKQDVSLARRLFGQDVEASMMPHYETEASFCRLIREWFDSEDEPSISAVDRCKHRVLLRNWLLEGYQIGKFPPPTRYVRGIPIVTFEGLVSNIERKLQLYAFVPGNMYNVRATGSQEVENFFSTFRDLEPTGKGIPKPDIIPEMLSAVAEVDNFRLDPDK